MGRAMPVDLGDFTFASKAEAKANLSELLKRNPLGGTLEGWDAGFAAALLEAHPARDEQVPPGSVIARFYVWHVPDPDNMHAHYPRRCIWVEFTDPDGRWHEQSVYSHEAIDAAARRPADGQLRTSTPPDLPRRSTPPSAESR